MRFNSSIEGFGLEDFTFFSSQSDFHALLYEALTQPLDGTQTEVVCLLNVLISAGLRLVFVSGQQGKGAFDYLAIGLSFVGNGLQIATFGLGQG